MSQNKAAGNRETKPKKLKQTKKVLKQKKLKKSVYKDI